LALFFCCFCCFATHTPGWSWTWNKNSSRSVRVLGAFWGGVRPSANSLNRAKKYFICLFIWINYLSFLFFFFFPSIFFGFSKQEWPTLCFQEIAASFVPKHQIPFVEDGFCCICLGLLQDTLMQAVQDKLRQAINSIPDVGTEFSIAVSVSSSILIREHALRLHLAERLK
jgi:hypothetical protein